MPRNNIRYRLKPPIMDEHIQAAIDAVGGEHDKDGHYGALVYTGCETQERAKEIKQGLFRAAKRLGVSVSVTINQAKDKTFEVHYQVHDKAAARQYVLDTYGSDPSAWPWSPRSGDKNYG